MREGRQGHVRQLSGLMAAGALPWARILRITSSANGRNILNGRPSCADGPHTHDAACHRLWFLPLGPSVDRERHYQRRNELQFLLGHLQGASNCRAPTE
jgi:hypothetical protein